MLDVGQIALDVLGIFDPTPTSDGTNLAISLIRGNWLDAGISVLGMIPYVGDLAKAGRLGRWAETLERVLNRAVNDSAFRRAVQPVLDTISGGIARAPAWVLERLSPTQRETLASLKANIDALETRIASAAARATRVTGRLGENSVTWTLDARGRPVRAEARLREVTRPERTMDETRAQREAGGAQRRDDDQGGHIVAHRFMGEEGELANLFPQNANFDIGAYRTLENELADWIEAGAEVRLDVRLRYADDGLRPDSVEVVFTVHDPRTGRELHDDNARFSNEAGQIFTRSTREYISERTRQIGSDTQ